MFPRMPYLESVTDDRRPQRSTSGPATCAGRRHLVSGDSAAGDAVSEAAWEAGVLMVPVRFFDDPSSFRLSLGRASEVFEFDAGVDALGAVLDGL
ncbi:hypothetical protein [Haloprofundus salinisoli]|uniref:hypothetical protein n=1 Tax=Haloprofundus salinisoli TaxID=2876193 RepID=UPI003CE4E247